MRKQEEAVPVPKDRDWACPLARCHEKSPHGMVQAGSKSTIQREKKKVITALHSGATDG